MFRQVFFRFGPPAMLLAGLLIFSAAHPSAATSPPTINCSQGGLLYQSPSGFKHCVDPAIYVRTPLPAPTPKFTGVPCDIPPTGNFPTVYADVGDGTCLPLKAMAPANAIAQAMRSTCCEANVPNLCLASDGVTVISCPTGQGQTNPVNVTTKYFGWVMVALVPAPGSNLCPAPSGLSLQVCQAGQTPP